MNFIAVTGMLEAIFIEDGYDGGAIPGRPVPGVLIYCLIEGLILQSMIQGTGLAMLESAQKIFAPVVVEVTDIRRTSRSGRAVVTSRIDVWNQKKNLVMSYVAKRLLAGHDIGG